METPLSTPCWQLISRRLALAAVVTMFATTAAANERAPLPICAIDMGSNSFRRIVGSFDQGRYEQRHVEVRTLGVGDDLVRHGTISDPKLAEIETVLAAFKTACETEGASRVVAVGTSAFREAPNGRVVVAIAANLGITMEIATERRESELAYLVGSLGQSGYAVIDNGSRSIELVSGDKGAPRYLVFNLGYRLAYELFFAKEANPEIAVRAFRDRLRRETQTASFMRNKKTLVGLEFGEMADLLFGPAALDGRVLTLAQMKQKLQEITGAGPAAFQLLKQQKNIDRALPRLVTAAFLTEEFGYAQLELTERELGTGLIIEAGTKQR